MVGMDILEEMSRLKENIRKVEELVNKNKDDDQTVNLVVVTKYVTSDVVRQLYNLGLRHFGENRSDELLKKQAELEDINKDIEWHFIGRLQTRPVRKIINNINYLHSLDRMSLVKEVNKRAAGPIRTFLQINISGEENKAGFPPSKILETVESLKNYPNIQVIGLMTMAPYEASEKELIKYFNEMKTLQEKIQKMHLPYAPCTELSMGMSDDYIQAIQEGATYIRVGRAIFEK